MISQQRLDELKRCDNPKIFFDAFYCDVNLIVKGHREIFETNTRSFWAKHLVYEEAIKNLLVERRKNRFTNRKKNISPLVFEQYRKQLSIAKNSERLNVLEQCIKRALNINEPEVVFREIGIIAQCLRWLQDIRESENVSKEIANLMLCKERLWDIIKKLEWKNITVGHTYRTRRSGRWCSYSHNIWVSPDFPDDPVLWLEVYDTIDYQLVYGDLPKPACSSEDELIRGYVALSLLYNKKAKERGESLIEPDILSGSKAKLQFIEIPKRAFEGSERWPDVRNVLISDLIAIDKDISNKEQNESQPVKYTGTQTNLNQHQTNTSGDNLQPGKAFLSQIAVEVEKLVMNPQNMDTFRQKIKPFVERWEQHNKDCENAKARREAHWQKVKNNPAWQDNKTGPPKKGWEWDSFYLHGLGYLSNSNPMAEMPAKYAPAVITAIEKFIKRDEEQKQRYVATSREYQQLDDAIAEQRTNLADIHSELDMLNAKESETAWIKTPPKKMIPNKIYLQFQWWRWIDLADESVFGCWRPPLKQIHPKPIDILIPDIEIENLPPPVNREQEYERYYVVLTSIHDNMLTGVQSISDGVWSKELAKHVWFRFTGAQPYGPDKGFIEAALERVQADIPSEQKTGGKIVLTQNQLKILNYLKKINTAVAQVDIESQTGLSNKTVSAELQILKGYNFVAPPKGKIRRIVITQASIDYLNPLK